jgi:hypothetical protein
MYTTTLVMVNPSNEYTFTPCPAAVTLSCKINEVTEEEDREEI